MGIGEIARDAFDRDAMTRTQFRRERFEPVGAARDQHERVSARRKLARECGADAGRGAGDEGMSDWRHGNSRLLPA